MTISLNIARNFRRGTHVLRVFRSFTSHPLPHTISRHHGAGAPHPRYSRVLSLSPRQHLRLGPEAHCANSWSCSNPPVNELSDEGQPARVTVSSIPRRWAAACGGVKSGPKGVCDSLWGMEIWSAEIHQGRRVCEQDLC